MQKYRATICCRKALTAFVITFSLAVLMFASPRAQADDFPFSQATHAQQFPALVYADWSVKSAHSLVSNPPTASAVWEFVNEAASDGAASGHVCTFRFVDLRGLGNLSLIVSIDAGGHGGCGEMAIFDKTASGFDAYTSWASFGENSVQDLNHDGKFELVLDSPIGPPGPNSACTWPLIFAWTGSDYREVSAQYKNYYRQHLNDLDKEFGAETPEQAKADHASSSQTTPPLLLNSKKSVSGLDSLSSTRNAESAAIGLSTTPTESSAASSSENDNQTDQYCAIIDKAKTEQFLGVHSDQTLSYAISKSESNDSSDRELAAYLFSYIGTSEATQDLRRLAADADSSVAEVAKQRLSGESDSSEPTTITYQEVNFLAHVAAPSASQ